MSKMTTFEPVEMHVAPTLAIEWDGEAPVESAAMSRVMGEGFAALQAFVLEHDLEVTGPPRAIYHRYGPASAAFTLAMPIMGAPVDSYKRGPVRIGELKGGKSLRFTHTGAYDQLRHAYDAIAEWLRSEGMMTSDADWAKFMPMWEEYPNDPASTSSEKLITHVYLPLR